MLVQLTEDEEGSCGNHGAQASEIKDLKAQIKQLKKKARPVIKHHKAWIKSVSMKKRLARKKSMKKKLMQKESVSKQGRKTAKSEQTVLKDPAFYDLDAILDDVMDYMEIEDAHDEGRISSKGVSTKDLVSTAQPTFGTDKPKVSTNKVDEGTANPKDGNLDQNAESKGVNEAERKFAQLASDAEVGRKLNEDMQAELEREGIEQEEATKAALIRDYDDIMARIDPDRILAASL
ncbi:hypothetical protein Tco_0191375 [Tanacetum coccineum]